MAHDGFQNDERTIYHFLAPKSSIAQADPDSRQCNADLFIMIKSYGDD
jgi:hypothetical protein